MVEDFVRVRARPDRTYLVGFDVGASPNRHKTGVRSL